MHLNRIQVGKILIDHHLITEDQLKMALDEQIKTGQRLGQILIDLNFISESELVELLSTQLDIPFINLKNYNIDNNLMNLLPELDARRLHAIVLSNENNEILVGMTDPLDVIAIDELEKILEQSIKLAIVSDKDLQNIFDISYRHGKEISSFSQELSQEIGKSDYDVAQLSSGLSMADAPVVKLLQSIFEDAVQVNASDVHIEPDESILRLRLRMDGVLHEQILSQGHIAEALSLRLKLMAGLNIAERRVPQDGRFSIKIKNKKFDVRLSAMPSQYGESVVMRLLNQSSALLKLEQIGMPESILSSLRRVIARPHGLLLITGPTGSGKTTALYGMLSELNTPDVKIITVEDPVEYRLPRITQVQVQPAIDLTFARVLRSILRQDPDVIMIGELRDFETAEIALRAAMTGHFVFSTLHTNDAPSSVERLIDMGVESFLLASVLQAVISQRLVRKICQNCIEDYKPTFQEEAFLESIGNINTSKNIFKHGVGCSFCYHTGYKSQIGVFEYLELNKNHTALLRKKKISEFLKLAYQDPLFQPLVINALELAKKGITTLSEVMRIAGDYNVEEASRYQKIMTEA